MSFGRLTALLLGDHCNDPAPMLASAQCTNALSESNVHCTRTLDAFPATTGLPMASGSRSFVPTPSFEPVKGNKDTGCL